MIPEIPILLDCVNWKFLRVRALPPRPLTTMSDSDIEMDAAPAPRQQLSRLAKKTEAPQRKAGKSKKAASDDDDSDSFVVEDSDDSDAEVDSEQDEDNSE